MRKTEPVLHTAPAELQGKYKREHAQGGGVLTMVELGDGLAEQHQVIFVFVLRVEVYHLRVSHLQELADLRHVRHVQVNIENLDTGLGSSGENYVLERIR